MKYLIKFIIFTILIINSHSDKAIDKVITLFLQKYPYFSQASQNKRDLEKYSKKVQQPGYLSEQIINHHKNKKGIPGVMCLYQGHVALSDEQGQLIFPRKQYKDDALQIYVLVAKGIKPAYMIAPSTVHNWQFDQQAPSTLYLIQLKQNQATALYYFETTLVPLPKDNNIPINTIIIISDPGNIFVPLGATITDYSPNLTLPNIYVKREFCFVFNSFYSLAIKQYFEQTAANFKQEGLTVLMIQQPNDY